MRQHLKNFFIPHTENNYHPHILHTKRAIFYSVVFIVMKLIVFSFALFVPLEVFVSPDVLAIEQSKLVTLTNDLRVQVGEGILDTEEKLFFSSHLKANDMANLQYFGHTGPDGHSLSHFLSVAEYNYSTAGENLAIGFQSAEDILDAWIQSPTHYDNLVDSDFEEFGLTLLGGMYEGQPVVIVAQHFGTPSESDFAILAEENIVAATNEQETIVEEYIKDGESEKNIAGETIVSAENTEDTPVVIEQKEEKSFLSFSAEQSFVNWEEDGDDTLIVARAKIYGGVYEATVSVAGHTISLSPSEEAGVYIGKQLIPVSTDDIFRVIISPTIRIIGSNGGFLEKSIKWQRLKIIAPSVMDRYIRSRDFLGGMTSLFSVSNNIFLGAIIFFITVLILSIVIEVKRQHPHVVVQTMGVILLLFSLWVI